MSKNIINEDVLNKVRGRFNQIVEYTFFSEPMLAEDDEENPEDMETPDMEAPQGGEEGDATPEMEPQGDEMAPPADTSDVEFPEGEESDTEEVVDVDTMQDGDEVVDIDTLTQSQEASEYKIDGVDEKLTQLLGVIDHLTTALNQHDAKIDDLKSEIEKRNPTEEERLNIRSQSSYPYSVQPKEYWDEKQKDSNYNVMYDNDVPANKEQEKYTFKKSDLNGIDDRTIALSMEKPFKVGDYVR